MKNPKQLINKTEDVDKFLAELNHPLTKEIQAVRKIIKGVNSNITEEVKEHAPSFSYKGYLVAFDLVDQDQIHLVFPNGVWLNDLSGLLEGDFPDKRVIYLEDMEEIRDRKKDLEALITQWVKLMD